MSEPFVAIVMGSDSDLPVMQACFDVLRSFDVPFEARITSAHRTPEVTKAFIQDADKRGCAVFIAAAGMAAHLAGAVSATTVKPVIGVPMESSLDGLDALLSTVQMPAGIPVASVALARQAPRTRRTLLPRLSRWPIRPWPISCVKSAPPTPRPSVPRMRPCRRASRADRGAATRTLEAAFGAAGPVGRRCHRLPYRGGLGFELRSAEPPCGRAAARAESPLSGQGPDSGCRNRITTGVPVGGS